VTGFTLSELDFVANTGAFGNGSVLCVNDIVNLPKITDIGSETVGCGSNRNSQVSNPDDPGALNGGNNGQAWQINGAWRNNDSKTNTNPFTAVQTGAYYRFKITADAGKTIALDSISLLLSINGNNTTQMYSYGELGDTPNGLTTSNTNLQTLGVSTSRDLTSNTFANFTIDLSALTGGETNPFNGSAIIYFFPYATDNNGFQPGTDLAVDALRVNGTVITELPPEVTEPRSLLQFLVIGE
jgi:hypothetical protein